MKRLLCCLAWLLGSPLLLITFYLCMMFGTIFLGPAEARRRCQPILDKITELANCCAGKDE
jgi:hypothetical protein